MIRFDVAATTDVGRSRPSNEDSFLRGDSVFAVADGMGGHLAGEVASTTALEPIAALDGKVFPDAQTAVTELRCSVLEANAAVASKAARDPSYRGMGTTLTAALVEGRRLHVAHVGDSRAYLLRDGEFSQLTTDHTLVQHLIDEGQITLEEAAHHPQRSIITRAIGVSVEIDVDTLSLELLAGDQVLLCSDGLSGVVDDEEIARTLTADLDPDSAATRLVGAANEQGGPDNITVVLLRFEANGVAAGDQRASGGPRTILVTGAQKPDASPDGWAQKLGRLGAIGRASPGPYAEPRRTGTTRLQRWTAVVVVLGILLAVGLAGGRWLLSRSFYVGVDAEQIAIFRGVPGDLGPFSLSWVEERTDTAVADLPEYLANSFREGRAAASLTDAQNIVANLARMVDAESDGEAASARASP